ncbi:class I SAM-dependent RNA methyltransferase [Lichenicoccus sp.]|uniref:class I SAM-dependent RNA methyltransferase n=1 Tax=Lichenicoccus sp. TaxID=2781899 RepID=UPI003D10FCA0
METIEAEVSALGVDGDGLVQVNGERLFIQGVLPGERVQLDRKHHGATLHAVLRPSPDRAEPPCSLFGRCGGCTLQHMSMAAMAEFKCQLVQEALHAAGFALPARIDFVASPPASRRRMDLAVQRTQAGIVVGLNPRGGGDVVGLSECHVLDPALFALTQCLEPMLRRLTCLRARGSLLVNLLDSGPDLLLATEAAPGTCDRARLAAFAAGAGIPRIAWRPLKGGDGESETLCALAPVRHLLSGATISPPPGAFLQASREGEQAIVAAVLAGLPGSLPRRARIVELYAGCGTLSFALARHAGVWAIEGDAAAVACLHGAAGGMRLRATRRDLTRQPLLAREFAGAAAIVLDPPFAGAGPQMPELARAGIARVILVSCNPRALARDATLLQAAGYRLEQLTIIDQFVWSSGVESVAVFAKPRPHAEFSTCHVG